MQKKKSNAGAIAFLVIGILFIVGGISLSMLAKDKVARRTDLYVVKGAEETYGIAKASGEMLADTIYTKIIMGQDVVYLKSYSGSLLYDLKTGSKTTLDGMESSVIFPKNKEGEYIDKYILIYGSNENVYRSINIKGDKMLDKDYSSLSEICTAIGAKEEVPVQQIAKEVLLENRSVVKSLEYLTEKNRYQYIVKEDTKQPQLYGVMDEDGKIIIPFEYNKIETGEGKNTAVRGIKDDKTFVIPNSTIPVAIDSGFEADIDGEGFIVQKKGNTGNKIYNLKGEIIIDKIFSYPITTITLNSKTSSYLFIKQGETTNWLMYNLNDVKKSVKTFSNINTAYLKGKELSEISTSFVFTSGGANYVVDLETFSTYKLGITTVIVAPLEPGYDLQSSLNQ